MRGKEIAAFRRQCERLLCFDWVQVPLVYTQVEWMIYLPMRTQNTIQQDGRTENKKIITSGYATWFMAGGAIREPQKPLKIQVF